MRTKALALAEAARAILLDWDGCVVEGGRLKPGARDFLRAFADKISILSNNSTHRPEQIAGLLARHGAPVPSRRVHLAGQVALEEAKRRFGARPIYLLANRRMVYAARSLGLNLAASTAFEAVVLLRDTRFSFRKLELAVDGLRAGAELIVSNPDLTHPKLGGVAPETGALLAAIIACVDGREVQTILVGKPAALLFEQALIEAEVFPNQAVMLGDNPDTDVQGAGRLGISAVLLGAQTGVSLETIMRERAAHPLNA